MSGWYDHLTESDNPPAHDGRVEVACGRILDKPVPKDWALVDYNRLCPKCRQKLAINGAGLQTRFWTVWTTGQEALTGE